ncbi:NDUFB5 [Cordylochernes scorpioides]|uniref:NADH dehydrogenase [ubiquinone] 1 beta subcomplex subunit 5, mitochondrial n=1 Tax=Cordylochernes scorpioides TaxID=51811 RepID=A0ABY6L813_9ARAC|nr:NDUFB5 [Cordylochernes scorpioides]
MDGAGVVVNPVRHAGDHAGIFPLQPSRFQFKQHTNLLHFYFMLGLIPVTAIIFLANIYVGPAELSDIPEGYIPQEHEYHKHPITRFLVKYFIPTEQQRYEITMYSIDKQAQMRRYRILREKTFDLIKTRQDYVGLYYQPFEADDIRHLRYESDAMKDNSPNDINVYTSEWRNK